MCASEQEKDYFTLARHWSEANRHANMTRSREAYFAEGVLRRKMFEAYTKLQTSSPSTTSFPAGGSLTNQFAQLSIAPTKQSAASDQKS